MAFLFGCSRVSASCGKQAGRRPASLALGACLVWASTIYPASAEVVTRSTIPGAVRGTTANSDEFIWRLMTNYIAAPYGTTSSTPALFETWASDTDVFSKHPHFPGPNEPHDFHGSVLGSSKTGGAGDAIDVQCAPPPNAGVAGFPTAGTPKPCIAEEVKRNRPQYDYIVGNNLNTRTGLSLAYSRSFDVEMPASAISVKGDWIPVPTLLQWIPQLRGQAAVEKLYLTTRVGSTEYALVSMHVSSKRNGAWVWGTFEHRWTPGRCDYIGCHDSFGAVTPNVPANTKAYNTQYGACPKTATLQALMTKARLSPVWDNYCLKGTMVDFVAADGTPMALGNSVTEGMNANGAISASSCITCHSYASYGAYGATTAAAKAMLGYNATGKPIPGAIGAARPFDFMWGVLLAPK